VSALVAVFAQAYLDTSRALAPLQRAGIAREMLNANQAARPFWAESLDLADRLGLLPRVVEIATHDPTIAAFHTRIASAYEAHLAEQAAAAASPTPIDPGSPVTAEQAEATLTRLLAAAAAKGYEKGRDDERRRATHHAHALAARAFSAPVAYPAVLDMANAISSGKAAP
jgi:hypothetical protein